MTGRTTALAERQTSELDRSAPLGAAAADRASAGGAASGDRSGVARVATGTGCVLFASAIVLLARVTLGGPVAAVIEASGGGAGFGFVVDRLAAVVLVLVTGIALMVQVFAVRYLRGDPRAGRFFAGSLALTAATAGVATAATLTGLVAAWVLASVSVCVLLAHRDDLVEGREGVRRAVRAFVVGDLALVGAAALVVVTVGDLNLRAVTPDSLADARLEPVAGLAVPVVPVVAVLVVVAALARSAQLPLPRWLPATLAAPTPLSALLHAGVVNAGGLLLIRLSPLLGEAPLATHLAFAAGAATAVAGSAAMAVRPDVKGALAQSTVAQMGFMVMQCSLGAFGAAAFHLVGHALYKAALFLGSGSAISHHHHDYRWHGDRAPVRSARRKVPQAALAAALPVGAVGAVAVLTNPPVLSHRGGWLVVGFAVITGAHATWAWLGRGRIVRRSVAAAAGLAVLAAAYLAAVSAFDAFLAAALAEPGPAFVEPGWAAALAVGVGAGVLAVVAGPWASLRAGLWVRLMAFAQVLPAGVTRRGARSGAR